VTSELSDAAVIRAAAGQVSATVDSEQIILAGGIYFAVGGVGAKVWELVQEPRALRDLREIILGEYDVDRLRCDRELRAFVEQLASRGLVEITDANAG
jgi:hypothetical protein